ncbi:MAG: endolytic transglycosylase MltG [Clostridiales Family XIII bacterium]|jgi:UPF0755 protein|nr:endolytic transglycosylase MltG [Clostridiales Family XIII bacterium]
MSKNEFKHLNNQRKKKHTGRIILIVILVIILLAIAAVGVCYVKYTDSLNAVDPADQTTVLFEVPDGATINTIAPKLEAEGFIKSALFFRIHFKFFAENSGYYQFGSHELSKSMTPEEINEALKEIVIDRTNVTSFTIPEGKTVKETMDILVAGGLVDSDAFMAEVRDGEFDYKFLANVPEGDNRLEGFLYPETYEVYLDATEHEIIDKMLSQFDLLFKPEYYDRATALGFSVQDAVTLASVIERECVASEERTLMSRVFQNRLAQSMPLQSCATIQYILGEPKEFLTIADTQIESPYNTYLYPGLPPGPICSPRIESVEAVLYPDENDFLYFVLSENLDGTHNFSADYGKFERDKAAYYRAVNNR